MSDPKPPPKSLSPQDWETLIDDFQYGGSRLQKWTSQYSITPSSILDLAVSSLLKKEFPLNLKLQLLPFIEDFVAFSVSSGSPLLSPSVLERLIESLRGTVQSPTSTADGVTITFSLKEQMMVSSTSIFISIDSLQSYDICLTESLVEFFLSVINRPNHGVDRQVRAVACECLRELERAYPCLLSEVAGQIWGMCQSERTNASQSYILLFTTVIHNIVAARSSVSILNTSVPLVPFNVPASALGSNCVSARDFSATQNSKDLRRAMAFLLESLGILTPSAMLEFVSLILPVTAALELQPSMLKVQFFGMIYSFHPMLCHVVLTMYLHFLDAYDVQEGEFARRLLLISREMQQHLVFRLLALHWFLGFNEAALNRDRQVGKDKNSVLGISQIFYPAVFDPLAIKTLKLDLLAFWSIGLENFKLANVSSVLDGAGKSAAKLFQDGLVSVLAFRWLPPSSTETSVAFRAFHKFLIGVSSHPDIDSSRSGSLMGSNIFRELQEMLVQLMLDCQRLVPVMVAFIDRLLGCEEHIWLGRDLLRSFDEHLLPKVVMDSKLVSYFPMLDRIAGSESIPPRALLDLLTRFTLFIIQRHGPDTGLKSWSHGSKVLGICRTMLMHHHSSRLFRRLSHLLALVQLYFPDLEVRDNARIYLRMLICIPGKKLRELLMYGDLGISATSHSSSFFNGQSPRAMPDLKKCRNISSYIYLERKIPLLVKQSWSLSLCNLNIQSDKAGYVDDTTEQTETDTSGSKYIGADTLRIDGSAEPLRVVDSKISEILGTLRTHFSCIPDYRHMPGLKVRIQCVLRFESEPFNRIWRSNSFGNGVNEVDSLPAIYATVLKFTSSAPYGSIKSYHVPFLLGEPSQNVETGSQKVSLEMVPVKQPSGEEKFKAPVTIELEPQEPTPGLVDISMESNAEDGEIIRGQLQSIAVGIEDMFLRAIVPPDIPEEATPAYYAGLFTALWEACGTPSNTGRETFPLKGGKGAAAVSGIRSVKLLEVPASLLIQSIENCLAPFVVSVVGESLVNVVKDGGIIRNVVWKDVPSDESSTGATDPDRGPLRLTYFAGEDSKENSASVGKRKMGSFLILIFLPPRFHLLFQMEVCEVSTLVRIRTDNWPCLAYVDEFLEALFLS